jgi:hypothetical protein
MFEFHSLNVIHDILEASYSVLNVDVRYGRLYDEIQKDRSEDSLEETGDEL